jgi:glycosyltransferase involved in cell wall biosynthesis
MTALKSSRRLPHVCFMAPNAFPVLSGDESSQVIGGAEVQQAIVARGLVARGYRVSMVCLDFGQAAIVDIDGIRVFRAFRPDAGIPVVRYLWPRLTSLWSCMRRADADIYYQRTAGMITGLVAAYCRRHRKKSIFSASGNPNFERNTRRIKYRRDRWLYEYGLMRVDRVLVQNPEQAELCLRNFGRHSTLVPNCYEPLKSSRSRTGRDILWVGSIRQVKRPQLFLDVAAALPQYQFTLVGGPAPENERMFAALKTRAAGMSNVRLMGFVPYSKLDQHFDNAALLLNTSESEGFPNTFLEAWSRSTVTVSFADCGARVDGMPVGRIVSSLEQMMMVINEFMNDEVQRCKEGARCKEYVDRNHAPAAILDLYEKIFAEMGS